MSIQGDAPEIRPGQALSKSRLQRLLAEWTPGPGEPSSSIYLRPGQPEQLAKSAGDPGRDWRERLSSLGNTVLRSDTGVAGLRSGERALVVLPPFPVAESRFSDLWDPGPLLALLEAEYTVGVVLLRLGRFSAAVYQGEKLLSSKTDSRYVKSSHHAGGTSQKRFQHIREGQMRQLYDKTCEAAQGQFQPHARRLEYVLLGGDRFTLNGFLKVCPYLEQFRDITLGRRLNVRDPKRDTLEQVAGMLRESRVYSIRW